MGVFHIFEIAQMVPNRATHHILQKQTALYYKLNKLHPEIFSGCVKIISKYLCSSGGIPYSKMV